VIIKERAIICPECGVRQRGAEVVHGESPVLQGQESHDTEKSLANSRIRELQRIARKDKGIVMLVSFLLSPLGYVLVGRWGLAIVNFLTLNYLLLGVILVPFHTKSIIENARDQLAAEGYSW
jgi:hypothetical protein